jgi:hypothetical protein
MIYDLTSNSQTIIKYIIKSITKYHGHVQAFLQ